MPYLYVLFSQDLETGEWEVEISSKDSVDLYDLEMELQSEGRRTFITPVVMPN